jgi:type IV pilus assembly protein PilM
MDDQSSFPRDPNADPVEGDAVVDMPAIEPVESEPAAANPEVAEENVWKKEVSFSRKAENDEPADAEPVVPEAAAEVTPAEPDQAADSLGHVSGSDPETGQEESVWKKEVSFSRKPEAEPVVEQSADEVQVSHDEPVGSEPDRETGQEESVWKKEVSFSRKAEAEPVVEQSADELDVSHDEPVGAAALGDEAILDGREPAVDSLEHVSGSDPETGPEESVWKKEVSFSRKAEVEAVVDHSSDGEAVPDVQQLAEEPVATEEIVLAPEPVAAEEFIATEEPAVTQELVAPDEPFAVETFASAGVEASAEPWSAPPVMPPAPAAESPPTSVPAATPSVEVHPPVAAADLPPHPDADTKVPFWKKEISLGGKKRDKPAKKRKQKDAEHAPEPAPAAEASTANVSAASTDVHAPVAAADPQPLPDDDTKKPFWKREISLGGTKRDKPARKRKRNDAEHAPEPAPAAEASTAGVSAVAPSMEVHPPVAAADLPPLPDADTKVPFWKKEIGGKKRDKSATERKQKSPKVKGERGAKTKEPKQPKERKQKTPKVKAERGNAKGRLVGLKIGASQLAAARVANNGSAELLQVAREPLDPGIIVGGELRDPDALAEALKDFFAKHGLPKKGVRLGIANNRIGVRTFEIAGVGDPKQLANAIRFRAQEALPIPIDEAVLDYQVLGDGVGEDGQPTKRVLLVVAYRELIDRYVDACKKAGITLVGIDLEAFALLRALQAPQEGVGTDATAALVVVAIGHERSTFAVSDGRVCEFTRVLEWGGSALNVAIARAIDAAPSEVEDTKRALSLMDEMVPEGISSDQAKKAREAMRRAIQTFARELVSSLQYYQNQPGSLGIGEIVLTGGTAHLPGLAGELERLIGVHVRVGDPLARMKVSKKVGQPEQIGSLAVAIGLGIED